MPFDINEVINNMKDAAIGAVKDDIENVPDYLLQVIENEKDSINYLAEARLGKVISDEEFFDELEREKKVLEVEMLTISIMTKAIAQKAINAAMNALRDAIKLSL